VIIAYAQRPTAGAVMESHYTFMIRTFWMTLVAMLAGGVVCGVGALLTVILIGFPIMAVGGLILAAAGIWFGVRVILGLVFASRGEAYPRPYAVLA
jgi:uncharacterized membrane protein